jgi:serine/threonine protein kinase
MAPETLRFSLLTDKTDIFTVGCVLFQVLTGQHLFKGLDKLAVLRANLNCQVKHPIYLSGLP